MAYAEAVWPMPRVARMFAIVVSSRIVRAAAVMVAVSGTPVLPVAGQPTTPAINNDAVDLEQAARDRAAARLRNASDSAAGK